MAVSTLDLLGQSRVSFERNAITEPNLTRFIHEKIEKSLK